MVDNSINDAIGQGIFFIEQDLEEYTVSTVVVHFGDLQECGSRVEHGYGDLAQDTRDNDGFS